MSNHDPVSQYLLSALRRTDPVEWSFGPIPVPDPMAPVYRVSYPCYPRTLCRIM